MSSVYKLQIHKWLKGPKLSQFSAELIQSTAVGAEAVHGVLEKVRSGELDAKLPARPPVAEWFALYEDHRRVSLAVFKYFPEVMGKGEKGQEAMDSWREELVAIKNDPAKFKRRLRRASYRMITQAILSAFSQRRRDYKRHLDALRREMRGQEVKDNRDLGKILAKSPEFHWYMRVALPCVVAYKTFPITLLRKARRKGKSGKAAAAQAEAIERLVRLDATMLYEPTIERWWNGVDGPVRQIRFEQLQNWAREGMDTGKFSLRLVKQSLGGLILAMANLYGMHWTWTSQKLTPAEITAEQVRQLFYAVAQDKAGRVMGVCDEDLEDLELESWRRAIMTHRKLWKRMFGPGGGFKSA